jgi:hypothetical protein
MGAEQAGNTLSFPRRKMFGQDYIGYKEVYTFARPRTRKEISYRPSKLVTHFLRRTGKVLNPPGRSALAQNASTCGESVDRRLSVRKSARYAF